MALHIRRAPVAKGKRTVTTVEILEGMMLVSFSISWYWSVAKMLRSKVASGKSLLFVLMICFGYILGISSKLVAWQNVGVLSPLIWVYAWNLLVTAYDAALVVHYSRRHQALADSGPSLSFGTRPAETT
jgi:hypothetical protein